MLTGLESPSEEPCAKSAGSSKSLEIDFLKIFSAPRSELISKVRVNVVILRQLPEPAPGFAATEKIPTYRNPDCESVKLYFASGFIR